MKSFFNPLFISLSTVCVLFSACAKDTGIGSAVLPETDAIHLATYMHSLHSSTQVIDSIYLNQDTLLLGAFTDNAFGSVSADILTQLACPLGFVFPSTGREDFVEFGIDSAKIEIIYTSWVGDGNGLLRVHAYELTDSLLEYNQKYPSNIDVSTFCDLTKPLAAAVLTPNKGSLGSKNFITMKLSDEFIQQFDPSTTDGDEVIYSSQNRFQQFFKGLYITTDFGSSAMLNVSDININYYYHYRREGRDTVHLILRFPSNREITRVNRILHPQRNAVTVLDSVTYISSPANFYTQVSIPMREIYSEMQAKVTDKKMLVSSVRLELLADNVASSYLKLPQYLLAVKTDSYQRFFDKKQLPTSNDTCATFVEAVQSISTNNDTTYKYSFDLSKLFATAFHKAENTAEELPDTLKITVLPVSISLKGTSSGTYISDAAYYLPISGLSLRNQNSSKPATLKILYSGF